MNVNKNKLLNPEINKNHFVGSNVHVDLCGKFV